MFLPNIENLLALFIIFEWGRILWKVHWINRKWNVMQNYFSVNVSIVAVVNRRQISKNRQFQIKFDIWGFWWFFHIKYGSSRLKSVCGCVNTNIYKKWFSKTFNYFLKKQSFKKSHQGGEESGRPQPSFSRIGAWEN